MTDSTRQALIAAFTFGLVAYAGTASIFFLNKRTSKITRDAPRLALIAFLISSALWAQLQFGAFLLNTDSTSSCQVMIVFASTFDQFARVCMQQSLLWTFSAFSLVSLTEVGVMQGLVVLRLILGGIFVGFQRPQLETVCVTMTAVLPVGITVSVTDTAFMAFLLIRVISRGAYSDNQKGAITSNQSRAVAVIVLGFIIWTGTSAPLMLSIGPMPIVLRTTVPAVGLLILIGLLTFFHHRLFRDISKPVQTLDVPDFDASRGFDTRQMYTTEIQGGADYRDDFAATTRGDFTGMSKPLPVATESERLPNISMPAAGQANVGMGGVPVLGQLFPLPKSQEPPFSTEPIEVHRAIPEQTMVNRWSSGSSLDERAMWENGDNQVAPRLENFSATTKPSAEPEVAVTTSAFLSPGMEGVRRRSPRQSPQQSPQQSPRQSPRRLPLPSPALSLFPRSPRSVSTPMKAQAQTPVKTTEDGIVNFSLPVKAQSLHPQSAKLQPPKSAPLAAIPRSNAKEILSKREDSARTLSVVHRPRPIPRKSNIDRALFPTGGSPSLQNHKRSQSLGADRSKQPLDTPADIDYDLSRLNEFANVLAANVPTQSETTNQRNTRRRSRSMGSLPIQAADFVPMPPMPELSEAKPKMDHGDAPVTSLRTPESLNSAKTSTQSPESVQTTVIKMPAVPRSPTSPYWKQELATRYGRRSSPILPIEDLSALTPSTVRDDDMTMDMADVRSPAMQVHLQRALTVTVTPKSQQRSRLGVADTTLPFREESQQSPLPSADANVGVGSELRRAEELEAKVGDVRPTFSARGYSTRPRRSVPPAPLVLRRLDNMYVEPSPVETDDSVSVEGVLQNDSVSPHASYQITENDRLALLTNLELELNQQEHQWQTIRHTMLARDSLSTVGSPPSRDSRYGSARQSQSIARGSRLVQRGELDADYDLLALFPQTDLKASAKRMPSSTYPRFTAPLGTPTPPDTDEESEYDEDELEALIGQTESTPAKEAALLWRPTMSVEGLAANITTLSLWTPASRPVGSFVPKEIPGESKRGPVRKNLKPLVIESSRLWEKSESKPTSSDNGLWQPTSQAKTQVLDVETQQQQAKPTRNPPRRIRRVTLLPDILESPKPLPNKRGTLGIFQFPWGDRSDSATVNPWPLSTMSVSEMIYQAGALDAGTSMGMQSNVSQFDMDDYEQDDGDYYDDSSETYDSDDEDMFERVEPASVAQPTDKWLQDAPQGKMHASHEDEMEARSESEYDDEIDSDSGSDSEAEPMFLKHFKSLEHEPLTEMHSSGNVSDDKANQRTSLRTQAEHDIEQTGDWGVKADTSAVTPTTTPTMTPTDFDLREEDEEKTRIRVPDRRQPQQIASISMPVPQKARCLLMDVDQASPGAPIRPTDSPHADEETCTDRESKSRGAPSAGHPSAPVLLSRFLERSIPISKPDVGVGADADTVSPSPLKPNPLVICKSETPTGRERTLVNTLGYPEPSSSSLPPSQFSSPQQATTSTPEYSMALWTPSTPVTRSNYGLLQPDTATWNSYLPTGEAARLVPAKADMPSIKSNSLWTAPAKKAEYNNFGLWGTKQPLPGMWTHSPVNTKISYGLPQPDAETWATYLIVQDDASRVKPREAEPASVYSTSLWAPTKAAIPETPSEDGLWSGSSSAASVSGSEPSTLSDKSMEVVNFGLWEPLPAVVEDEEPAGLFSLSHRRTNYRTTKMAPAAQGMERAPRRALEAFPDFGFTHLWNMAPLWDSKANTAAIKLQREIDSLILEGLFSLNHSRNTFRTTSASPAALDTRPKQRISQQSLPQLTSDSLWSVHTARKDVGQVNWLSLSTIRPRATSVASSFSDNDSIMSVPALTRTSSIKSERSRPAATPTEWLAALDEAIKLGSGKTLEIDTGDSYQLWSKPDADVDEPVIASDELWKPMNNRFLELTPTKSEFDQIHSESGTSQRGRTQKARPPMPMYPGSSSSAFLPGASETPRDFSTQALWAQSQSEAKEDGSWMNRSMRKGLSFVQLW
ncbi:hypothetical protein SNK04_009948 [Fusarium graminearum]